LRIQVIGPRRIFGLVATVLGGAAAGEAIREFSTGLYLALSPERPGAPHPDTGLFATMSFLEPVTIVRIIIVTAVSVFFLGLGLRVLGLRLKQLRGARAAGLSLLAIAGAAFVEAMMRVWFAVFVFPATQAEQIAFQKTIPRRSYTAACRLVDRHVVIADARADDVLSVVGFAFDTSGRCANPAARCLTFGSLLSSW
jgi:hypothetical protein